jgi:nucleotide-binding universal stress UspA family protein
VGSVMCISVRSGAPRATPLVEEVPMSSRHNYTIVVGTDFSELADRAIDHALEMASLRQGSEVHVLYVEPDAWVGAAVAPAFEAALGADAAVTKVKEQAERRVDAMAPGLRKRQIRRVMAHFGRGSAAENIAQLAARLDADLVVVGSHGRRGVARLFLGSVAERVSHLARCPVSIIRPKDHSTVDRVPEIEPPCPACLEVRRATGNDNAWCARHSERHYLAPHTHHYASNGIYSAETTAYESMPEHGA